MIDLTLFRPLAGDPQVSALRGVKTHKAHLAKHGREISLADLHKSAYAKSRHSLYTRNWPLVSLIKVGLKTEWTCGSLLHPLDGDPHHRHRLFVTKTQPHDLLLSCVMDIAWLLLSLLNLLGLLGLLNLFF